MYIFKFQYDNTLSELVELTDRINYLFKFQYDNTLSSFSIVFFVV